MTSKARLFLKLALLAAVLAVDVVTLPALLAEMGASSFLRVALAFSVLAGALVCAALVQSHLLRLAYAIALAAGAWMILGFRFSANTGTTYFDFVTTVDARASALDALALYWPAMLMAGLVALLTLVAVALKPPSVGRKTGLAIALLPVLVGAGLIAVLVDRAGQIRGIPSAWKGVGFAGLYAVDSAYGLAGEREVVSIARTSPLPAHDIVLIVDESVSANYLDLNLPVGSQSGAYSGLMTERSGWAIRNFGIAASMTNCSMVTNVGLRFGAGRTDFQRKVARAPSIWAYAKNAGLRTVYLYGQRGGENENYMSDVERQAIDDQVYYPDIPLVQRDQMIAQEIASRLNNDTPEFILASKTGAHFPLTGLYHEGKGRFMPEAQISALSKDAAFWNLYRNNYRNALDWTVGAFFDRLFAETNPSAGQATILYTSDHGQTLHENAKAGSLTHCRGEPAMEEGAVPLVVIQRAGITDGEQMMDWTSNLSARRDASSHYQIFPSLLLSMGYDAEAVGRAYPQPLTSGASDPMTFAVWMQLRLGGNPVWHEVKPDGLYRPQ